MFVRCLIVVVLVAALAALTGCGLQTPAKRDTLLDRNWGKSFEAAKQNQILNPDAGKNENPVMGLDGQSAESNMKKYRKSFEAEKAAETGAINLNLKRP